MRAKAAAAAAAAKNKKYHHHHHNNSRKEVEDVELEGSKKNQAMARIFAATSKQAGSGNTTPSSTSGSSSSSGNAVTAGGGKAGITVVQKRTTPKVNRRHVDGRPVMICKVPLAGLSYKLKQKLAVNHLNRLKRKRNELTDDDDDDDEDHLLKSMMPPPKKQHYDEVDMEADLGEYQKRATQLKHDADRENDLKQQQIKYLKAVLYFTLCGNINERRDEKGAAFTMYKETLNLIK